MAAPRTLTRGQFRKTQAAKSGGTYDQYLHYLAVHRARLGTAPPDPLAPTPAAQLGAQASQAVHAQVDPILKQIQDEFGRRTTAGNSAINAGTKTLMEAFKSYAPAEQAAYTDATRDTSSLNTALANRLTGQGTAMQGELQAKLAQINAPGAQQDAVAGGAAAVGAGAANAGFASGAANISNLIAQGAAGRDYGAKLPGYAALTGARNLRDLAAQTSQQRATALGDVNAKVPGLISSELDALRNLEFQKATARLGFQGDQASLRAQAQRTRATIAAQGQRTQATIDAQGRRTQAQIDAANARTAASLQVKQNAAIAAAQAKTDAAKRPNSALSKTYGHVVDSNGNAITTPDGKTIPVKSGAAAKAVPEYPNLSKSQVTHLRAGIASAFNGVPEQKDVNGKVVAAKLPPVDYQTAINHAVSAGYSRAAATRMANHFYMPGQRGRPAKPHPDTGFRGADLG